MKNFKCAYCEKDLSEKTFIFIGSHGFGRNKKFRDNLDWSVLPLIFCDGACLVAYFVPKYDEYLKRLGENKKKCGNQTSKNTKN